MLSKEEIENKAFTYYKTIESRYFTLEEENEDVYLALALIQEEDKDDKEFPIQLEYNTSKGLFKIKTYYNNPKLYNEYFYIGNLETVSGLNNLINNELKWDIKQIDLNKLHKYE